MPKILELKEIDGKIWARIGKINPPDFPSGVALWTPDEQAREKKLATYNAIENLRKPSEKVVGVGWQAFCADKPGSNVQRLARAWDAMIDEVLRDVD